MLDDPFIEEEVLRAQFDILVPIVVEPLWAREELRMAISTRHERVSQLFNSKACR